MEGTCRRATAVNLACRREYGEHAARSNAEAPSVPPCLQVSKFASCAAREASSWLADRGHGTPRCAITCQALPGVVTISELSCINYNFTIQDSMVFTAHTHTLYNLPTLMLALRTTPAPCACHFKCHTSSIAELGSRYD